MRVKEVDSLFWDTNITYRMRGYRRAVCAPTHEVLIARVADELGMRMSKDEVAQILDDPNPSENNEALEELEMLLEASYRRKRVRFLLYSILTDSRLRVVGCGKQVHESWGCMASKIELMQLFLETDLYGPVTKTSPLTRLVDTLHNYVAYVNAEHILRELCSEVGEDFENLCDSDVQIRLVKSSRDGVAIRKLIQAYRTMSKTDLNRIRRIKKFVQREWEKEESIRDANRKSGSALSVSGCGSPAYLDMTYVQSSLLF